MKKSGMPWWGIPGFIKKDYSSLTGFIVQLERMPLTSRGQDVASSALTNIQSLVLGTFPPVLLLPTQLVVKPEPILVVARHLI
jgi:hypothetical protein